MVRLALAAVLILGGLAVVAFGIATMVAPEGDLGRSNLIQVGLAFTLFGLFAAMGGCLILRRHRTAK
jgi:hypothetical protein